MSFQGVFCSPSAASWQTIQEEAHGMAARRFGLMCDSHSTQLPKVRTSINAPKCSLYLAEAAGIALDIANRDVALAGVLDSVQLIRTG
jgi:hypothetical protein